MHLHQNIYTTLKLNRKGIPLLKAWTKQKLTDFDTAIIILIIIAITAFLIAQRMELIDNLRLASDNRSQVARNALQLANNKIDTQEKSIIAFLNQDYMRIDGVRSKVKLQFCDAAGDCHD